MAKDNDLATRRARAHTVYQTKDGTRVPGVTTIIRVMDKPALVPWANRLGLQGIEVSKYVDELADVGKLAHYLIEGHLKKTTPELGDYSKNQIDLAENSFLKFLDWQKRAGAEFLASELELVSEQYRFGGQIDIIARINGVVQVVDIKTAKAVYDDMFTQVGGYFVLAAEHGYAPQAARIVRVGRNENEGFEDKPIIALDLHVRRFHVCRDLYNVNNQIKAAGK